MRMLKIESRGIRYVHSPRYGMNIGAHVFPVVKYRLLRELLLKSGEATEDQFVEPLMPTRAMLNEVHTSEYLDDLENLAHSPRTVTSELPLTREIVEGFLLSAGGSLLAARLALENRACLHIGGGLHHGFADHAEGFCYVNDVAVACRMLRRIEEADRILIVDLDVHQGNGTAKIFEEEAEVYTFSMHQERNYPIKEDSDWDVGLPDGIDDKAYLEVLANALPDMLSKHQPNLVFYLAGADPYREDQLGGLGLTIEGLKKRDAFVLESCKAASVPVAITLAGGYAVQTRDTLEIHANTAREMTRLFF